NDPNKIDKWFFGRKIYAPSKLAEEIKGDYLVIICSQFYTDIKKQLEEIGLIEKKDFIDARQIVNIDSYLNVTKRSDKLSEHVTEHLIAKLLIEDNNTKIDYKDLYDFEFKVYSQWGEDGIIQYLISKI